MYKKAKASPTGLVGSAVNRIKSMSPTKKRIGEGLVGAAVGGAVGAAVDDEDRAGGALAGAATGVVGAGLLSKGIRSHKVRSNLQGGLRDISAKAQSKSHVGEGAIRERVDHINNRLNRLRDVSQVGSPSAGSRMWNKRKKEVNNLVAERAGHKTALNELRDRQKSYVKNNIKGERAAVNNKIFGLI